MRDDHFDESHDPFDNDAFDNDDVLEGDHRPEGDHRLEGDHGFEDDHKFDDEHGFDDDHKFDDEHGQTAAKKPLTTRAVALTSARTVIGLVAIGVAGAVIAASALLPLPTVRAEAPGQLVTPVPAVEQLVCPGALLRLSDESGAAATDSSAFGAATVRSGAGSGDFVSAPIEQAPIEQSDASTGGTAAAPTVLSVTPAPDASTRALVSGAQSEQLAEGDFVGLAASGCGVATGDSWLVGGSTAVGRTTLITLTNPTGVSATVDLELFDETGRISAAGTTGIVVQPAGQRVLSLAGFLPGVVSPVVHVVSTGGVVVASMQQSIIRGLTPGGVDMVESVAALSTDVVIPGVLVADLAAVQALGGGGDSYYDTETVLRIFAPGDGTTSVAVELTSAGNAISYELDLEAGRVVDVPIDDLATGSYTIRVLSGLPIVAAARVTAAAGATSDFAWSAASAELRDVAQFTVADGPSPLLHLANPTTVDTVVTLRSAAGTEVSVTVGAGASVAVPVDSGQSYDLSGFESLRAAVTLSGGGLLARYAVQPPSVASGPLTIYR